MVCWVPLDVLAAVIVAAGLLACLGANSNFPGNKQQKKGKPCSRCFECPQGQASTYLAAAGLDNPRSLSFNSMTALYISSKNVWFGSNWADLLLDEGAALWNTTNQFLLKASNVCLRGKPIRVCYQMRLLFRLALQLFRTYKNQHSLPICRKEIGFFPFLHARLF